jgi:6-pyruvoyltetrahydropterin/6-carboxytetrahydropterin synthase
MIQDFEVIADAVRRTVLAELDHRSLNDLIDNPTAEHIVLWIWKQLAPVLPQLTELVLWETRSARVVLRRGDPLVGG